MCCLAVLGLAACGAAGHAQSRLQVVAAEDFWGSIASQLGGDRVTVRSIIVNPDTDPHSYEPTPSDARTMAGSTVAIVNAGEATEAVGALLLLGLIAAPAGTAIRLTANPRLGVLISSAAALASVWVGITLAYLFPTLPPSSTIIGVAVALYAAAFAATWRPSG